ncbi:hypothetical protein FHX50_002083 [Helcobacillus massiliensis]|uniref:Uncharacterized protein n=1 Tax=Helcobacillus massiliensis TaxID=521392 RepID=A0A839QUM6_9MICO|nr:hypothetical protein [Helcobacillus massiliensis]
MVSFPFARVMGPRSLKSAFAGSPGSEPLPGFAEPQAVTAPAARAAAVLAITVRRLGEVQVLIGGSSHRSRMWCASL